ncbi:hypothetical protein OHR68_02160 [Spirillospora sp. NBC_00431]
MTQTLTWPAARCQRRNFDFNFRLEANSSPCLRRSAAQSPALICWAVERGPPSGERRMPMYAVINEMGSQVIAPTVRYSLIGRRMGLR